MANKYKYCEGFKQLALSLGLEVVGTGKRQNM